MKFVAIVLGLLISVSFSLSQPEPTKVAFEDVLKAPDLYHGKLIETRGFLVQEYENSALYFNEKWRETQGIWVTSDIKPYPLRAIKNHYVEVIGVFNANDHGHLGQFKGSLTIKKYLVLQDDSKPSKAQSRA